MSAAQAARPLADGDELRASAPLRADLAGGTLDLWPLYLLHRDASTVNVALRLRARASYRPRAGSWELQAGNHGARRRVAAKRLRAAAARAAADDGDPFALVLRVLDHVGATDPGRLLTIVEGPPGSGIGGSSALLIALYGLAARLTGRPLRRRGLAELALDLEAQVLKLPTGCQDYYPAIHGGALQIHHRPGGARVERLAVDLAQLERRLILAYSGLPHSSGPSNWRLFRRRLEGDERAVEAFARIADAAGRAGDALRAANWTRLAAAMNADWEARKRLDRRLAPRGLRTLERAGLEAGAIGAKGCGAAAGGCMLFLLRRPDDGAAVEAALTAAGASLLPARLSRSGLRVERVAADAV